MPEKIRISKTGKQDLTIAEAVVDGARANVTRVSSGERSLCTLYRNFPFASL